VKGPPEELFLWMMFATLTLFVLTMFAFAWKVVLS